MTITSAAIVIISIIVWMFVLSKQTKRLKPWLRITILAIYFGVVLYTPLILEIRSFNWDVSSPKVIADIFWATSYLIFMVLLFSEKFIWVNIFFLPIDSAITAVYHHIRGMTEQRNGDILTFVIMLILTLLVCKPIISVMIQKSDTDD